MKILDLNMLPKLIKGKNYLLLSDIPLPFRKDLNNFIKGETFMPNKKHEIRIGNNLYKAWLEKLFNKGFDYEVNLKINE